MNSTTNPMGGGGRRPPGPRGPRFTDAQKSALWNIPRITGALSVVGSCLLLYMIVKSSRHGLRKTQNRLLFGISVVDIPFSFMFVLGTLLMPSKLPVDGARGNFGTCSFQGCMLQIGYAQPLYNAFLMAYYAITVCGGGGGGSGGGRLDFTSKNAWWIETICHAFCILFAIGTTVAGGILEIFNPSPVGRCAINSWPMGCVENPRVPCQRGENHRAYKWAFNLGPTLVSLGIILVALALLCLHVLLHEQRVQKHASQRGSISLRHATGFQPQYTQQVVRRALLYAFIFLNTYSWITAANLVRVVAHSPPPYWLVLMGNVLQPFQGFFNFLLYLKPRYDAVRKSFPEWWWWRVCYYAIHYGTGSLARQSSRQLVGGGILGGSSSRIMGSRMMTRWSTQKQQSSLSMTSFTQTNADGVEQDSNTNHQEDNIAHGVQVHAIEESSSSSSELSDSAEEVVSFNEEVATMQIASIKVPQDDKSGKRRSLGAYSEDFTVPS